jgi:hypothetical protein
MRQHRRRLQRLLIPLCRIWRWVTNGIDLLILVRVPTLAVAIGVLMVVQVPQVRELFEISISADAHGLEAFWAWLFAGGLSVLAWYSARTLFRFRYPTRRYDHRVRRKLAVWLPRLLITAVPLAMALIHAATPAPDGSLGHLLWASAYLALAVGLMWLAIKRRAFARRLGLRIESRPPAGDLRAWGDLGRLRYLHYLGLAAGIAGGVIGAAMPDLLTAFGPLALLLGGMAWLVMMSTAPVHLCARYRIPLLSSLLVLGVLWTALELNDNHAVRLVAGQDSTGDPPADLSYHNAGRPRLAAFIEDWWDEARQAACGDRAWQIASEGGGIRAAMWTTLVLSELDAATEGRLWECTLAASGVSGGSLGLAAFAVHWRDTGGRIDEEALVALMQDDFLAPVLGSIFGADLLQRVLPGRLFTDRGQALEDAWVSAFDERLGSKGTMGLKMPLAETAFDRAGRPLPALLLHTTIVADGRRLIQHPFSAMGEASFPGSVDGSRWLPAELPVFSAVHNSARFTLVSPAGTVRRRTGEGLELLGQLVDGGYYENSATTPLPRMIEILRAQPDAPRAVGVVHISNGPGVAAFAPAGNDRCPGPSPSGNTPFRGELRAPATALLATREARARAAREALAERITASPGDRLWHYRLCRRQRAIPLGWTIGEATTAEMREQLGGAAGSADNAGNSREIAGLFD